MTLQLTKLEQGELGGWENAEISGRDREDVDRLLARIIALVSRTTAP